MSERTRQVVVSRRGGPDAFEIRERPLPAPGPGQVTVRVEAAGVAFGDLMWASGVVPGSPKPPYVSGYDFIGRVEDPSPEAGGFLHGQRVAGVVGRGALAERVVVDAGVVVPISDAIPTVEAAALPLNYLAAHTVYQHVASVKRGQSVLVHGAGGGMGTALLDLGRLRKLVMIGTASGAKRRVVESFGARHIDYMSTDFVQEVRSLVKGGVALCVDHVGGSHLRRSARSLARGGRLVSLGAYDAAQGRIGKTATILGFVRMLAVNALPGGRKTSLFGVEEHIRKNMLVYRRDLRYLFDLLAEKRLRPVVDRSFPFEAVGAALERVRSAAGSGKVVVRMPGRG